jgi:hypothetical protein
MTLSGPEFREDAEVDGSRILDLTEEPAEETELCLCAAACLGLAEDFSGDFEFEGFRGLVWLGFAETRR